VLAFKDWENNSVDLMKMRNPRKEEQVNKERDKHFIVIDSCNKGIYNFL